MMKKKSSSLMIVAVLVSLVAHPLRAQNSEKNDDPDAHPPAAQADLQIVKHAREILSSPSKWNRADTRICPAGAATFSIYCALEKSTKDVTGDFQHRGAAMQEARFVIDELVPGNNYHHRLMDYNNDPATTFADVQKFFLRLQNRIAAELKSAK